MRQFLAFTALVLLLLQGSTRPVTAQTMPGDEPIASSYDIAFAYYKLSHQRLDIRELLQSLPFFQSLTPYEQDLYYGQQRDKLKNDYATFSPLTKPLLARLPVSVKIHDDLKYLQITFDNNRLPYFPYSIMGKTITLFPENITDYLVLPLADDVEVQRARDLTKNNDHPYLMLSMIANHAKTDDPILIDGLAHNMLVARIVEIRVITRNGLMIWSHTDPTYASLLGRSVNALYAGSKRNRSADFMPVQNRMIP